MVAMPQNENALNQKVGDAITEIICKPELLEQIENKRSIEYLNYCLGEEI